MILLRQLRLVNWYGFTNTTAPIGLFTLIAGKNGNGKSVLLDAIKYAAYGDTVFNKSSDIRGERSRTLVSYTRGLLDATANTYMRPPEKFPNVYTHIALEYYDEAAQKNFVLGTIIETSPGNNCQNYRYVLDNTSLQQVEHTHVKDGVLLPYSAREFQKRYRVELLPKEQGLLKFLRMTGLRLDLSGLPVYLRKLRGIMTYRPEAKIDEFIRNSVLHEKNIDFGKLIEARENIEKLQGSFASVEQEITALKNILQAFDRLDKAERLLLIDDIKIVYKKLIDLESRLSQNERDLQLVRQQASSAEDSLQKIEIKTENVENRLRDARVSLGSLDCARLLEKEEEHLNALKQQERTLEAELKKLHSFQRKVSELLHILAKLEQKVAGQNILAALCEGAYTGEAKKSAVADLKTLADAAYDEQVAAISKLQTEMSILEEEVSAQHKIIDECAKHRNAYRNLADYVGLRDEINKELAKYKNAGEAKFACEYVIALKDEAWRDALEAFLGARRYTILVDPAYYDVADDVLNKSSFRHAHIFNTKLLMRKALRVEKDSVVHKLDIKNKVAAQYFAFHLGRMHGVKLEEVRNFENAISVEGRVSVAMDSYFLRFERIGFYYLGQKTFELNKKRAEKELQRLLQRKQILLEKTQQTLAFKERLKEYREAFGDYDYEAAQKLRQLQEQIAESEQQYKNLQQALQNNSEFMELTILIGELQDELKRCVIERKNLQQRSNDLQRKITACEDNISVCRQERQQQKPLLEQYERDYYALAKQAKTDYDNYLTGARQGNVLQPQSRQRQQQRIDAFRKELYSLKAVYDSQHPDLDYTSRSDYAARHDHIWMDDLQDVQQKLQEQTQKYEDIFKKEFVLNIYKSCEEAKEDLRRINLELSKLDFAAKYQFDVRILKDGSDYAKILAYAKYLEEREQAGSGDGQMSLSAFVDTTDEQGEMLEKELKQIVNRIVSHKNEDLIRRYADYRNYMEYEILVSNALLNRAKLSKQTGLNSGAEVQIPYLLILIAALLMTYNQRSNSTRLVFIDEPFAKMDTNNVKIMLGFMKRQKLQVIFCSPDKTETIGNECEVILPALRVSVNNMQLGIIQFNKEKAYAAI